MKHYIIVKFKDRNDTERVYEEVKTLFEKTLEIDGVNGVTLHKSNSDRTNRYSLMIEMDMTKEALEVYDACDAHKQWKAEYGDLIESKAIFDCD